MISRIKTVNIRYKKFHFIFEYIEGVILIQKTSKRGLVVKKYTKLKWRSKILINQKEFKTYLNKKIERKKHLFVTTGTSARSTIY